MGIFVEQPRDRMRAAHGPARKGGSVVRTALKPEIRALDFPKGYELYQDFVIMCGSDAHANRVIRLIVDYCEFDSQRYMSSAERIAQLPTTNPNEIEGIEETLVRFAMEVYMLAYRQKLFDLNSGNRIFGYEFLRFAGSRLLLQRKKIV